MTKRQKKTVTKATSAETKLFKLLSHTGVREKKLTPAQLVDAAGAAHKIAKEAEKAFKPLRDQVEELGLGTQLGKKFVAIVNPRSREYLDREAVVAELGQKWVDAHMKGTPYVEVHFYPRAT